MGCCNTKNSYSIEKMKDCSVHINHYTSETTKCKKKTNYEDYRQSSSTATSRKSRTNNKSDREKSKTKTFFRRKHNAQVQVLDASMKDELGPSELSSERGCFQEGLLSKEVENGIDDPTLHETCLKSNSEHSTISNCFSQSLIQTAKLTKRKTNSKSKIKKIKSKAHNLFRRNHSSDKFPIQVQELPVQDETGIWVESSNRYEDEGSLLIISDANVSSAQNVTEQAADDSIQNNVQEVQPILRYAERKKTGIDCLRCRPFQEHTSVKDLPESFATRNKNMSVIYSPEDISRSNNQLNRNLDKEYKGYEEQRKFSFDDGEYCSELDHLSICTLSGVEETELKSVIRISTNTEIVAEDQNENSLKITSATEYPSDTISSARDVLLTPDLSSCESSRDSGQGITNGIKDHLLEEKNKNSHSPGSVKNAESYVYIYSESLTRENKEYVIKSCKEKTCHIPHNPVKTFENSENDFDVYNVLKKANICFSVERDKKDLKEFRSSNKVAYRNQGIYLRNTEDEDNSWRQLNPDIKDVEAEMNHAEIKTPKTEFVFFEEGKRSFDIDSHCLGYLSQEKSIHTEQGDDKRNNFLLEDLSLDTESKSNDSFEPFIDVYETHFRATLVPDYFEKNAENVVCFEDMYSFGNNYFVSKNALPASGCLPETKFDTENVKRKIEKSGNLVTGHCKEKVRNIQFNHTEVAINIKSYKLCLFPLYYALTEVRISTVQLQRNVARIRSEIYIKSDVCKLLKRSKFRAKSDGLKSSPCFSHTCSKHRPSIKYQPKPLSAIDEKSFNYIVPVSKTKNESIPDCMDKACVAPIAEDMDVSNSVIPVRNRKIVFPKREGRKGPKKTNRRRKTKQNNNASKPIHGLYEKTNKRHTTMRFKYRPEIDSSKEDQEKLSQISVDSGLGSTSISKRNSSHISLNDRSSDMTAHLEFYGKITRLKKKKRKKNIKIRIRVLNNKSLLQKIKRHCKLYPANECKRTAKSVLREMYTLDRPFEVFALGSYFDRLTTWTPPSDEERMQYEWLRLATFHNYTGNGNALALARNGFYHDHTEGPTSTRCYLCNTCHSNWEMFDDVSTEHRRQSPSCLFHENGGLVSVNIHGASAHSVSSAIVTESSIPADAGAVNETVISLRRTRSGREGLTQQTTEDPESRDNSSLALSQLRTQPSLGLSRHSYSTIRASGRPQESTGETERRNCSVLAHTVQSYSTTMISGNSVASDEMVNGLRTAGPSTGGLTSVSRATEGLQQSNAPSTSTEARQTNPAPSAGGRTDPTITVVVDKHPDYVNIDSRVSSYQGWPDYLDQTPRQMSEAGFFYVGVADFTRCYCCGGGLRNWEPGDDPMLEHTRWFPRCEYVNKLKGERYVAAVQRRHQEHMAEQQRQQIAIARRREENRNPPDPMTTEAAAVMREMGYSADRTREAILAVRRQTGSSVVTTQQVLTWLLDDEERRLTGNSSNTELGIQPPPSSAATSLVGTSTPSSVVYTGTNITSSAVHTGTSIGTSIVNTTSSISTATSIVSAGTTTSTVSSSSASVAAEVQQSATSTSVTAGGSSSASQNQQTGSGNSSSSNSASRTSIEKQSGASGDASEESKSTAKETATAETTKKKNAKKKAKHKAGAKSETTGATGGDFDAKSLKAENEKLREMQTCKICMERAVNTTLLPCGHLVCCDTCAARLQRCPICRKRIKGTVKTFMS